MKSKKVKKPRQAINKDGAATRQAKLNARAKLKGWTGISEYLTDILKDKIEIPQK